MIETWLCRASSRAALLALTHLAAVAAVLLAAVFGLPRPEEVLELVRRSPPRRRR